MPHVVVEYSKNLEQSVDISELIRVVHDAMIATDAFPLEAVRTRAAPRDDFRIADGDPRNAFLAVVGRIAPGRPQALRHELGRSLFEAVQSYLSDVSEAIPLSITVELQEIDQTSAFRHNSIVARLPDRLAQA
jgi:5-carboxymethyl-2-hydroxymuconate isomerase